MKKRVTIILTNRERFTFTCDDIDVAESVSNGVWFRVSGASDPEVPFVRTRGIDAILVSDLFSVGP